MRAQTYTRCLNQLPEFPIWLGKVKFQRIEINLWENLPIKLNARGVELNVSLTNVGNIFSGAREATNSSSLDASKVN